MKTLKIWWHLNHYLFFVSVNLFDFYGLHADKSDIQALKVARKLKAEAPSGYSNDSNPFGDSNLTEKFVNYLLFQYLLHFFSLPCAVRPNKNVTTLSDSYGEKR